MNKKYTLEILESGLMSEEYWSDPRFIYTMSPEVYESASDAYYNPCGLGFGWKEDLGWYILGCGQGPHLVFVEKNENLICHYWESCVNDREFFKVEYPEINDTHKKFFISPDVWLTEKEALLI